MKVITSGAWARLINAATGIWLMAAPAVLGYGDPAATNDRLVGPLAASLAIIAIWEATRGVRNVNTLLGLWLIAAPLILGYPTAAAVSSAVAGIVIAALSRVRGEIEGSYGGGWRTLWGGA